MNYRGIAHGKTIELEEALPYANGQAVQVVVEPLTEQLPTGSPATIRKVMHELLHLTEDDVAELERAIERDWLPVGETGVFDRGR
jgi:predicted nucleic acid-binding protein